MPVYRTLQCTQVNIAEIKLSAFPSQPGVLTTWQPVHDVGHDCNGSLVIMLQILKCSHTDCPLRSYNLTFQRPHKFYELPQFCFHLKYPNVVVIKELSQSFWTLSKLPCRSAACLNAPICCQASAAVHLVNRVGPHQPAKATVPGCRVLSAGSIQCLPPAPWGDPWWSFAQNLSWSTSSWDVGLTGAHEGYFRLSVQSGAIPGTVFVWDENRTGVYYRPVSFTPLKDRLTKVKNLVSRHSESEAGVESHWWFSLLKKTIEDNSRAVIPQPCWKQFSGA